MVVRIPKEVMLAARKNGRGTYLEEHQLSSSDVAYMFGVTPQTVINWWRRGYRGYSLPGIRMGGGSTSPVAYRIYDVLKFSERTKLSCSVERMPPAIYRRWRDSGGIVQQPNPNR